MPDTIDTTTKGVTISWKQLLGIGGVIVALLLYIHNAEVSTIKANTKASDDNTTAILLFNSSVNQLKGDLSHVDELMIEKWANIERRVTKLEEQIE